MAALRTVLSLLLVAGLVRAQDDGCGCGEDDEESQIEIGGDGGPEGSYDLAIDPFQAPPSVADEPNRPEPVKVGEWQPPKLDDAARKELAALLAQRGDRPDDVAVRYRLADFYLAHKWFLQAEAELLHCATLDPGSIRPWEALLRVYRAGQADQPEEEFNGIVIGPGGVFRTGRKRPKDWLPSLVERNKRVTRAYVEVLERRPDDVARRRELIAHLKGTNDIDGIVEHARKVLLRLPSDADTRFDLAEAVRRVGERENAVEEGSGAARLAAAEKLLEENLKRVPDHAPSALRLVRMIAVREGGKAADRIEDLEKRAFFHLFMRKEFGAVPYREDTFRMARNLSGPRIANQLWDDVLVPKGWRNRDGVRVQRWIVIHFPNAQPRARDHVVRTLARRGDPGAAGTLLSFLWHLEDPERWGSEFSTDRKLLESTERDAIEATASLGGVAYPPAERFLRAARQPHHRRRIVKVLSLLKDKRAMVPLLDALAWDVAEKFSYGVAAGLEALGDPRAIDGLVAAAMDVRRPTARRREAAEALAAFQDPRCVEALNRIAKETEFGLVSAYGLFRLAGNASALKDLEERLTNGSDPGEVVRLLEKHHDPRFEAMLLLGLENTGELEVRRRILDLLKRRHWKTAEPKVRAFFLKLAEHPSASDLVIRELGEMGGEEAAGRLQAIVKAARGERWSAAARAFAQTGDPRAVRYFNRMRILDKDPQRRRLAETLYALAAKRHAILRRAAGE